MPPDIAGDITASYISQGVIGTTCVVLALVVLKLWTEIKGERAAHKIELASKDALIKDLYEARLQEAKAGFDIARTTQSSLDAFLAAVSGKGRI
ncbi:hypothetical protein [Neorhizobium sp. JUb45]|uniref:hypothetical protein n=1 Tax=Neorhizobium sp. JUb45 TaxID=2485113 RepID=UPI001045A8BC|nr:hypothetical protein [Neorhizobium sp. JUb45]TCR01052.1 hypothetical protein EDF70_10557 [Neorhizobium sp. JUb45]